jgi:hypothetical protein
VAAPKNRRTTALYAVFVLGAAVFIVSSVWQIASQVFAAPPAPATNASGPRVGPGCAAALSALARAVDKGVLAAAAVADPAEAAKRYTVARGPSWEGARKSELLRACEGDPAGPEAVAALARLDRVAESAIRRQSSELAPVRREVDSFIR